jgi:hypothetical protein
MRNFNGATANIYPSSAGSVADAAPRDDFCNGSTCLITIIHDQSSYGNHNAWSFGGHFPGPRSDGSDDTAGTVGAPVTLNGKKAYDVFVLPGTGISQQSDQGHSCGDESEGMYGGFDGTHYNDACYFDYGKAETNGTDTGASHMEAIYFSTCTAWGSGAGNGPWIMADLENGVFAGQTL